MNDTKIKIGSKRKKITLVSTTNSRNKENKNKTKINETKRKNKRDKKKTTWSKKRGTEEEKREKNVNFKDWTKKGNIKNRKKMSQKGRRAASRNMQMRIHVLGEQASVDWAKINGKKRGSEKSDMEDNNDGKSRYDYNSNALKVWRIGEGW